MQLWQCNQVLGAITGYSWFWFLPFGKTEHNSIVTKPRSCHYCSPLHRRIKGTDRQGLGQYVYCPVSITYSLYAHSDGTDYIIPPNSGNLHALSVVLPKADLNYQKLLGYKSVKPRHLQAVRALECTRAITIRALGLRPPAPIALAYSKAHTALGWCGLCNT